jgi:AAA domain
MNNDTQTTTLEPSPEFNPFADRVAQEAAKPRKTGTLAQVTTRKRRRPVFGVLEGTSGVGKSTFASESDNPIFIPTERGLDQITTAKFPTPKTLEEFGVYLDAVDKESHDFKTLVIDTVDALELLIFDAVIAEARKTDKRIKSIEEVGGGWQKGYLRAREYWQRLLSRLTSLSERMNVLLIAHSHLRTVNDPMIGTAYDVFEMKVQQKSAELIKQSVDLILFARLTTAVAKDTPRARKGRGLVSGDREMYTQPTTGIEAKNRFNLENPMEFSWASLQEGIEKFYQS